MSTPQTSNSSKPKKWRPTVSNEAKKLSFNEDDWTIASSQASQGRRTRGKYNPTPGVKMISPPVEVAAGSSAADTPTAEVRTSTDSPLRPLAPPHAPQEDMCQPCSTTDDGASAISDVTDGSVSTTGSKSRKPPASRVIIEVDAVTKMLEDHLKCPACGDGLTLTFPTLCVASSVRLDCKNKGGCTYSSLEKPTPATQVFSEEAEKDARVRNSDYAVNALCVLSFLSSGDGGTEAAQLLGLLGLPNNTTMQARSFTSIETHLSGELQKLADDIIMDNLRKEVRVVLGDKADNEGNKLYDLWLERKLPKELWPKIHGCADMGWNQKGSGRKRNSKSGHAFMYGTETRTIIAKEYCSKGCAFCKSWYTRHSIDDEPPVHDCKINFEGSSGAMEPYAILKMYKWLYENHVLVETMVADDDSSIKAKLK